jgi:hypothetical protein
MHQSASVDDIRLFFWGGLLLKNLRRRPLLRLFERAMSASRTFSLYLSLSLRCFGALFIFTLGSIFCPYPECPSMHTIVSIQLALDLDVVKGIFISVL